MSFLVELQQEDLQNSIDVSLLGFLVVVTGFGVLNFHF